MLLHLLAFLLSQLTVEVGGKLLVEMRCAIDGSHVLLSRKALSHLPFSSREGRHVPEIYNTSCNRSWRSFRARCSLDFTVSIGIWSSLAISS